ncbi:MAG: transcriptional repressor [Actinomycetota bacterium]
MDDLLQRLETRGWRLTPQRRAVVDALQGRNVHLSADEVLERVRSARPDTSRATVYNTLNELVELGEVGELQIAGRSRKYDPNVGTRHHHVLCEECGLVQDIQLRIADEPAVPPTLDGFELRRTDVLFSGVCVECVSAAR